MRNPIEINPKRLGDNPVKRVDLIDLEASNLKETVSQGNSLLDEGYPGKDQSFEQVPNLQTHHCNRVIKTNPDEA